MRRCLFFLALLMMVSACRKDIDDKSKEPIVDPPKVKVVGSVIGQVVDSNGANVQGAEVAFSNLKTYTNEFGVFVFEDEELYKDGTYISVSKEGFFDGSRRFYPSLNEASYVTIQMMEKIIKGTISSAQGGKVSIESEAFVDFPPDGFSRLDGSPYSGNVNVAARWLDPTERATLLEMPGDLTGIDVDGEVRALASYGMIVVELISDDQEELQLKEGKKALIQMPVPEELIGSAPSSIPLWHFDESQGIWIEEGEAQLVNGVYEGEVSHFSFWNCDAPFPLITLSGNLTLNGSIGAGLAVEITMLSTGATAGTITDGLGGFEGKVPQDEPLLITVYDYCGAVIHEEEIGSFSADEDLGTIHMSVPTVDVTVTGQVTNCISDPVGEAYVIVSFDGGNQHTFLADQGGSFSHTLVDCSLAGSAEVFGVDVDNVLISPGTTIDFTGDVNIGDLEACNDFLEEGVDISFSGQDWPGGDSTTYAYSVQVFNLGGGLNKYLYNITVLSWSLGGDVICQGTFIKNDGQIISDYDFDFPTDGFSVGGADGESLIVTQGGGSYVTFSVVSTGIMVTDPTVYQGATSATVDILLPF